MNKYRSNRLQRIAMIMSILEYRTEIENELKGGKTIAQLAEFLDVPIETVRNDIYQLTTYAVSSDEAAGYIRIYLSDDNDKTIDESGIMEQLSIFLDDPQYVWVDDKGKKHRYKTMILRGDFDHILLRAEITNILSDRCTIGIALTSEDAQVVLDFARKNKIPKGLGKQPFYIKNDVLMTEKEEEMVDRILKIKSNNEGKPIVFSYKGSTKAEDEIKVVIPSFLVLNVDWGFVYLQDQNGYRYRLERMGKNVRLAKDGEVPEMEKKPEGDKTHVNIRISEGSGFPIHSRVERDLQRMYKGRDFSIGDHLRKVDDKKRNMEYYIYEDDVDDVNQLKSWIHSYGSAMIVLEPKSLRDEVIDSYKRRKAYYDMIIEQEKREGSKENR